MIAKEIGAAGVWGAFSVFMNMTASSTWSFGVTALTGFYGALYGFSVGAGGVGVCGGLLGDCGV